jgi:membrane protein implicated in regulation of membrane protease activity
MKRRIQLFGLWALALALLLFPFAPIVRSQSQGQQPNEQQQSEQQKGQAYVGQVVKAKNGQYALLINKETGTGYYLDDQDKAKQFEGQNVKVIGRLDVASRTIHISDIEPA